MFFEPRHHELAERLQAAAPGFEDLERPGAHARRPSRDRAAAAHLASTGLFEIVVPTTGTAVDSRALPRARDARLRVGARRLDLRGAGAGLAPDRPRGQRRPAPSSRRSRAAPGDRRVRAHRARGRLRRRRDQDPGGPVRRRSGASTATGCSSRTSASPITRWCSRRRIGLGAAGLSAFCKVPLDAPRRHRRADDRHRAAPDRRPGAARPPRRSASAPSNGVWSNASSGPGC